MIDMEVATATAFIVCFDATAEIVYVIVKSYLCERTAIWTFYHYYPSSFKSYSVISPFLNTTIFEWYVV